MGKVNLLVALEPPKKLSESIMGLRKYIVKKTGKDLYGKHKPHVTLYVNTFNKFSEVDEIITKVAKNYKKFEVNGEGIHTFFDDNLSGGHTVVYKLGENKKLQKLQKDIMLKLVKLRTDDQEKWCLEKSDNWPKQQLDNIKKFGFPYSYKDYIFHASIGAIPKETYKKTIGFLERKSKKFKWKVGSITVYIMLGDDGFVPYKKYDLK